MADGEPDTQSLDSLLTPMIQRRDLYESLLPRLKRGGSRQRRYERMKENITSDIENIKRRGLAAYDPGWEENYPKVYIKHVTRGPHTEPEDEHSATGNHGDVTDAGQTIHE